MSETTREQKEDSNVLVLPPGTRIVTREVVTIRETGVALPAGAVGVIVKAPSESSGPYRVRFPDGSESALMRSEMSILKAMKESGLREHVRDVADWQQYVVYKCVVGSRAYGLEDEGSDTDRRGFYLPPADLHWSLYGVPEQLENEATQEAYWEIEKFLRLALKANPNILECLYTPLVESSTDVAEELLSMRHSFLSRLTYQTYNGYVLSQFKKLEQDLRTRGAIKWKHAMHLVRLLLSGITILREEHVPVRVDEHRERLLAIKRGELVWDEVDEWRLSLHRQFDDAVRITRLPEHPDFDRVNAFLLKARLSAVHR
jgi:predicted nucleotidyltransferase